MSKTERENILNQASFSKPVWEACTITMNMFKGGKLKGQSTPKVGAATSSIKQHHLQPLHHLPQDFQVRHCLQMYMYASCVPSVSPMITSQLEMLQKLNTLQLSFSEMKEAATKFGGLQVAKTTFTEMTGCNTWNEASAKFPHHAVEEQIRAFAGLSFKGGVPEVFKQYCRIPTHVFLYHATCICSYSVLV